MYNFYREQWIVEPAGRHPRRRVRARAVRVRRAAGELAGRPDRRADDRRPDRAGTGCGIERPRATRRRRRPTTIPSSTSRDRASRRCTGSTADDRAGQHRVRRVCVDAQRVQAGRGARAGSVARPNDVELSRPVPARRRVPAAGDQERHRVRAAVRHDVVGQCVRVCRRTDRGAGGGRVHRAYADATDTRHVRGAARWAGLGLAGAAELAARAWKSGCG